VTKRTPGRTPEEPRGELTSPPDLAPLSLPTDRIIVAGILAWGVALVLTLVVPTLNEGPRDWWPWTCLAGVLLGFLGLAYVRRGRGNAAQVTDPDSHRYY
jgi:hypothetical protein